MIKKYVAILSIFLQLAPALSWAALSSQDTAHFPQNNILNNPGFESGAVYWTGSPSSTFTVTTNNVYRGNNAGVWTTTASNQSLTSFAMTYSASSGPNGLNGVAVCRILNQSSIPGMVMQITDGTNVLGQVSIPSDAAAVYSYESTPPLNFVFPSITTGTKSLYLKMTNTSGFGTIKTDDCFVMTADSYNLAQVSQALDWGSLSLIGGSGCQSVATGASNENSYSTLGSGGGCNPWTATGNVTAPATNSFTIPLGNTIPGTYRIHIHANIQNYSAAAVAGITCNFQLLDPDGATAAMGGMSNSGTSTQWESELDGSFTWTTGKPRTISIQASGSSTNTCGFNPGTTGRNMRIDVDYFPSTSQQAINSNQNLQPTVTTITTGGCTPSANCSGSTYTPPAKVTRIEIEMVGAGGGGAAGSTVLANATAGGSTTFGTLTAGGGGAGIQSDSAGGGSASGGNLVNIVGAYGQGAFSGGVTAGGQGGSTFFGGAGSGGGQSRAGGGGQANSGSGGGGGGGNGSGQVGGGGGAGGFVKSIIANPSSYTFSVGSGGAGGTTSSGLPGGAGGSGYIAITEYYGFSAPIVINSITTNAPAAYRVESAVINNTGSACTVSGGTSLFSSATYVGTGNCAPATFATAFSAAPVCTCTASTGGAVGVCQLQSITATSIGNVLGYNLSGAASLNTAMQIICQGPR